MSARHRGRAPSDRAPAPPSRRCRRLPSRRRTRRGSRTENRRCPRGRAGRRRRGSAPSSRRSPRHRGCAHRAMRAAGADPPGPAVRVSSRRVRLYRRRHWPSHALRRTRRRRRNSRAEPLDDLLHAAPSLALGLRAQCRVGREQDAFGESDRGALLEARQRHEVGAVAAKRGPVAFGILDQLVGFGDPQRAAAALEPVVEDDRGDLAALAGAGAVAEKPAAPEAHRACRSLGSGGDLVPGLVDRVGPGEMAGMRLPGIDDAFELRVGQEAALDKARRQERLVGRARRRDGGHRGRLHELGRMRLRAGDAQGLQRIAFVERGGQASALGRRPVAGLVGEFDGARLRGDGGSSGAAAGFGAGRDCGAIRADRNTGAGRGAASAGRGGTRRMT